MASIKEIKSKQELKGADSVRGEYYLIANRGSANEATIGFTTEGTFSVSREYRNSTQNQTVSGVKGLVHLDSATVTFETQSLQLDGDFLTKLKGFVQDSFTDEQDAEGTIYERYKEPAFVDWNKYIDTLDLMFEFNDGKVGAIRMFNVIDKSEDTISFNRTDDTLFSVLFEATIDENDNDEFLPYEILIEKESDQSIVNRALSNIHNHAFTLSTNDLPNLSTQIEESIKAYLIEFNDFKDIDVAVTAESVTDLIALIEADGFGFESNVEVELSLNSASGLTTIGASVKEEVVVRAKSVKSENKKEEL